LSAPGCPRVATPSSWPRYGGGCLGSRRWTATTAIIIKPSTTAPNSTCDPKSRRAASVAAVPHSEQTRERAEIVSSQFAQRRARSHLMPVVSTRSSGCPISPRPHSQQYFAYWSLSLRQASQIMANAAHLSRARRIWLKTTNLRLFSRVGLRLFTECSVVPATSHIFLLRYTFGNW
jgi:hypothetical protein